MTQEPVNFNALLYVNSGTEEVPEACVFDALWDMNDKGEFIEVQGTAEGHPFSRRELEQLLGLAESGIGELIKKQRESLAY